MTASTKDLIAWAREYNIAGVAVPNVVAMADAIERLTQPGGEVTMQQAYEQRLSFPMSPDLDAELYPCDLVEAAYAAGWTDANGAEPPFDSAKKPGGEVEPVAWRSYNWIGAEYEHEEGFWSSSWTFRESKPDSHFAGAEVHRNIEPLYSAATVARLIAERDAATKYPADSLVWLYTHCRAIGMTCKSDSGKWEEDIALFTANLKQERDTLQDQVKTFRSALEKIADWDASWGPYPENNEAWRAMVVVTAREAVPRAIAATEPKEAP